MDVTLDPIPDISAWTWTVLRRYINMHQVQLSTAIAVLSANKGPTGYQCFWYQQQNLIYNYCYHYVNLKFASFSFIARFELRIIFTYI